MRRIRFLIWKELIELGQDPRLFLIVIMAPIVQLFMLAYAATTDVRNVPIVVADADRSQASRELVSRFDASTSFTVIDVVSSPDDVDTVLERGDAWLALVVPRGYGQRSGAGGADRGRRERRQFGRSVAVVRDQPDRGVQPGTGVAQPGAGA